MSRVLVVPDLHCPFEHPAAFDFLAAMKRHYKPTHVVCIGDEADFHNFARWPRDPDAIGPVEEVQALRKSIRQLAKLFPKMTVCDSNHTYRPLRRAHSVGLPTSFVQHVRSILDAPAGWFWAAAASVDGVAYIHGEGFAGPDAAMKAATAHMCRTVIGHVHAHAGVRYAANFGGTLWGMNVGCLVDVTAPAFGYGRFLAAKPVLGCGLVTDGVPNFIPMGAA